MKIASLLAILLFSSCATSHILVGNTRTPRDWQSVRVYRTPPPKYEEIAFVNADGAWGKPGFQGSMDMAVSRLRERAGDLGANGVILNDPGENARRPATPLSGTAIWVP